jgi:hypothetical protein
MVSARKLGSSWMPAFSSDIDLNNATLRTLRGGWTIVGSESEDTVRSVKRCVRMVGSGVS